MAEYQLTETDAAVIRTADQAFISNIPPDQDWLDYQDWLEDGGEPDPYVPPEPMLPQPSSEDLVLYDHENRIRGLEGQPPLSLADFAMRASSFK